MALVVGDVSDKREELVVDVDAEEDETVKVVESLVEDVEDEEKDEKVLVVNEVTVDVDVDEELVSMKVDDELE